MGLHIKLLQKNRFLKSNLINKLTNLQVSLLEKFEQNEMH